MDDVRISRGINTALRLEFAVDETDVSVTVLNGTVTMVGRVSTGQEKLLAELLAKHATGARHLDNRLVVGPPTADALADSSIRRSAIAAMRFHRDGVRDDIQIHVRHGTVTMHGAVCTLFRHDLAESSIKAIDGVAAVRNHLTTNSV